MTNTQLRHKAERLAGRPYGVVVDRDETTDGEQIYLASNPELPGCLAHGKTKEEAVENLRDARTEYVLSLLEDGLQVPPPTPPPTPGRRRTRPIKA